jgi:hypothetical protein
MSTSPAAVTAVTLRPWTTPRLEPIALTSSTMGGFTFAAAEITSGVVS